MAKIILIRFLIPGLVFFLLAGSFAQAHTRLVSLPDRRDVTLRLDETGSALVQEKRILSLKKGINHIDFSWQNVMIDPSSIILTPLSHPDRITLLSVSFPPGQATLVWEISSLGDLEEEVMISYLPAHIDAMAAYQAIADPGERTLELQTYLVIRNFSGESFDAVTAHTSLGKAFSTGIRNLETKKIMVARNSNIPIKKIYTWDETLMPHEPEKLAVSVGIPTAYELANTGDAGLGHSSLWPGKTRVFQEDGQDSTLFLGEDTTAFTPVGDKTRLHIGDSRDIVVTQLRTGTEKTHVRRNTDGQVQVYDEIIKKEILMENLKDRPITLSLIQTVPGHWENIHMSMDYTLKDHQTLIFDVLVPARAKKTLTLHYKVLNIFAGNLSEYNHRFD